MICLWSLSYACFAATRLRQRLARWQNIPFGLSGQPGRIFTGIHRRLMALSNLVPPRVQSAMLHTLFNGWCTHRRMQLRNAPGNQCVFRCKQGAEDSIEHYCRCDVVQRVAQHVFRLQYPAELGLDIWSLNSAWLNDDDRLRSIGILVYGTYNAFNTLRHKPIDDPNQAYHCILQHCKQGAFGHDLCMRHLDTRWRQPLSILV